MRVALNHAHGRTAIAVDMGMAIAAALEGEGALLALLTRS
jgi:hypothetical protein